LAPWHRQPPPQENKERKVLIVDAVDWFGGRTRSIELAKYDSKVSIGTHVLSSTTRHFTLHTSPPPTQLPAGGTFALFEHNDTLQLAKEVQPLSPRFACSRSYNTCALTSGFVPVTHALF
jgi:hypothetical protein